MSRDNIFPAIFGDLETRRIGAIVLAAPLLLAGATSDDTARGALSVSATVLPTCTVEVEGSQVRTSCTNDGRFTVATEVSQDANPQGKGAAPNAEPAGTSPPPRRSGREFTTISF